MKRDWDWSDEEALETAQWENLAKDTGAKLTEEKKLTEYWNRQTVRAEAKLEAAQRRIETLRMALEPFAEVYRNYMERNQSSTTNTILSSKLIDFYTAWKTLEGRANMTEHPDNCKCRMCFGLRTHPIQEEV